MPRALSLRLAAIGLAAVSPAAAGPLAPSSQDQNIQIIAAPPAASAAKASSARAPSTRPESAYASMPVTAAPKRNMGGGFLEAIFERDDTRYYYAPPPPPPRYYRAPAPRYYSTQPRQPVVIAPDPDTPYEQYYIPPRTERPRYVPRSATPNPQRGPDPRYLKTVIPYTGSEKPGTVVIDTSTRYLYLVQDDGTAIRYGIGVGRPGFQWKGVHSVTAKKEWPDWTPPAEMLARQPHLPRHMEGGPDNPLGARAMYLGSTLYRIHGSNEPWTIGHAVSSGCFRMTNDDVMDLYERVNVGAKVVVL